MWKPEARIVPLDCRFLLVFAISFPPPLEVKKYSAHSPTGPCLFCCNFDCPHVSDGIISSEGLRWIHLLVWSICLRCIINNIVCEKQYSCETTKARHHAVCQRNHIPVRSCQIFFQKGRSVRGITWKLNLWALIANSHCSITRTNFMSPSQTYCVL